MLLEWFRRKQGMVQPLQPQPQSAGLAAYARPVGEHGHVVERPAGVQIGRPAHRPPEPLLAEVGRLVASCGATSAYWFWMSVAGERPHLGLAVAPDDDAVVAAVGAAVEPLWRAASPGNPTFDVLRLGSPLDGTICREGEVLVPWAQDPARPDSPHER